MGTDSSLRLPSHTPLRGPPLSVITECQAELPVLFGSFPPALCLHMVVYICQSQSPSSSPTSCPHIILCICVSFPVLQIGSPWEGVTFQRMNPLGDEFSSFLGLNYIYFSMFCAGLLRMESGCSEN